MRSVLVVGGNGFVGSAIARHLSSDFRVTATHQGTYTPVAGAEFVKLSNLGDKNACKAVVAKVEPEIVIYCAGSNDILEGEQNMQKTQLAHSAGVTNVFATSDTFKSKFIYISTDYVFSGVDGNYSESSTAIPAFQLGKSKLGAENFLRSRSLNFIIIRCAPLLGRGTLEHPSMIDEIREASLRKRKLKYSTKSIHNPVHISVLQQLISKTIETDIRNKYFHVGGLTKVSIADLAKSVVQKLKLEPSTIEVIEAAASTLNSDYTLNFSETSRITDIPKWSLEESLERFDLI
jgi:dTDP-4-dehydrorhamnose reductase